MHAQAKSTGPALLSRIVRLHYNWNYEFLRPTVAAVVERYKLKFGHDIAAVAAAAHTNAATAAPAAAAPADAVALAASADAASPNA